MDITNLTKKEQRDLMKLLKPVLLTTHSEIAIEAGVSPSLVSYVMNGHNSNRSVIDIIFKNLPENWQELIPASLLDKLMQPCH